jgi:DNA-binding LytR/AlgR family response regulator
MNCIIIDDDPVIQKQLVSFINKSELLNFVAAFRNPIEAYQTIKSNNVDLIFLDIEMPEMSGLEFLDELMENHQIIIISGDRKYALDTFEYNVTDYLLKPIEYSRFIKAIYKGIERSIESKQNHYSECLFVKISKQFVRIKFSDVICIEKTSNNTVIVTKRKTYSLLNNIVDPDKLIKNENFIQLNDSFIVNLKEIEDVCDNHVCFRDNCNVEKILVDESKRVEVLKRINA